MAHELYTSKSGKTAMAFVGDTPWHGLGQRVTKDADIATWAHEAGLDWTGVLVPVRYTPAGHTAPLTMDGQSVLYRDDTHDALAVVSDDYKIVQPREVLEFFRDLTESGGWHIHTAGVIRGGRKLWAMASNHTEGEACDGDRVRGNLLLATSMDGSMRTHVGMTAVRVVCANTIALALNTDGAGMVKVSHRSVFNPQAVKQQLGVARESFADFMDKARKLSESPIGQEEARDILRELFGKPVALEAAPVTTTGGTVDGSEFAQLLQRNVKQPEVREHRSVTKVMELFNGAGRGANHPGAAGTAWGLLNAVTEQVDHFAGRGVNTRLESAWFGNGADVKQSAFKLLLAR